MKKIITFLIICFSFSLFAGCKETIKLSDISKRFNELSASSALTDVFDNNQFNLSLTTVANKLPEKEKNSLIMASDILALSSTCFLKTNYILNDNKIQKSLSSKRINEVSNNVEIYYSSLVKINTAKQVIESNANFDIATEENANKISELVTHIKSAYLSIQNISIILIDEYAKSSSSKQNNANVYELKILQSYIKMLKNLSYVFYEELDLEGLYLYGRTDTFPLNNLSNAVALGYSLRNIVSSKYNTTNSNVAESFESLLPLLENINNSYSFINKSAKAFDFKNLKANIVAEHKTYSNENLTKYLNSILAKDKGNYNFVVQNFENDYNILITEMTAFTALVSSL